MKHEGKRYNVGKRRLDLLHPLAIEGISDVFTYGALKYEDRNWEKGMSWSDVIASLKRHLTAIERGEDYDEESGLLHIDHVQCNAHMLSTYYHIYPQGDDRRHSYLNSPKIGLDIDEVLCDWLGAWRKLWNIEEVPDSWFFDRNIKDKFNQLKEQGKLDEFYLNLDVNSNISPENLPFEPHCYITSRPVDKHITEMWLDKYNFPARPVYTVDVNHTKVEVAKKAGINIFVDDRYENFVELNNAGICCYLFDAPHNKRYDVGHKRIKNLDQLKYVRS